MFQKVKFSSENTFLDLVQIETLFWTICSKQFGYVQNSFGLIEGQYIEVIMKKINTYQKMFF